MEKQPPKFAPYYTLLDYIPPSHESAADFYELLKEAKNEIINGSGDQIRFGLSEDDILFVAFLRHLCRVFEKARTMIADEKFTTRFHGNKNDPFQGLAYWEIVPLMAKDKDDGGNPT